MNYQIEITRFSPEPVTEHYETVNVDDAAQRVLLDRDIEVVVFVAAIERERNLDWGNFYVWCNAERALIKLHEHCEHFAIDPSLPPEPNEEVQFRDEDGCYFSVPFRQTVTTGQALAALRFWLPNQEHTSELKWS